jgi:hypothetical protein
MAISDAVRPDHTETKLEKVRDLVPPSHRQVREAMDL